jgi:hypothetical protein
MNTILKIIAIVITMTLPICAETKIFKDYNFTIEKPESWNTNPNPDNVIFFTQSSDGSKLFLISASKIDVKISNALSKMVDGWKKSATSQGVKIDKEEIIYISNIPFNALSANFPDGNKSISYMAINNDIAYSLIIKSSTIDPATDEKTLGMIKSFKFIDSSKASAAIDESSTTAYRYGQVAGRIAFAAFIIGAIIIMIKKSKKTT